VGVIKSPTEENQEKIFEKFLRRRRSGAVYGGMGCCVW